MDENNMVQDDEISLFDLWGKLLAGWRYVVGGTVLGVVGAVAAIVLMAPTYEATTTLQVGRVAGNEIEAPSSIVERFKSPAFLLAAAQQLGDDRLVDALRNSTAAVAKASNAQLVKGTSLVQLTTRGPSAEESRKLGGVMLAMLVERHEGLAEPLKARIASEIALTREKLGVVERELNELSKVVANGGSGRDSQFAPVSLLTSQRMQKQTEAFGLRQQLSSFELSLLPPTTQPTQALEMTYVAERPISPKKTLLLALGLIGGLLAGVVSVFFVAAWRRAKEGRQRRLAP